MKYRLILLSAVLAGALFSGARPAQAYPASDEEAPVRAVSEKTGRTEASLPEGSGFLPGLYEIASAADSDFLLDVRHCTVQDTDSRTLQLYQPLDVNQQKFYLELLPDGFFRVSALHTGDALTAGEDHASVSMTPMEHPEDKKAAASQTWTLEDAGDGACYIRADGDACLTLDAARAYLGAPVALEPFAEKRSQKWLLRPTWISASDTADTDLANPYAAGGRFRNLRLALKFGDRYETLTAPDLAAHMAETEDHRLQLDPGYLDSFVEELAARYDTQGQPKTFTTSYGNTITLYQGNFGWKLDTKGTEALLKEYLETDLHRSLAPKWSHRGRELGGDDIIGDSYVEVDLENQKVFLYKNGKKLLETDCVSGTAGTDRETPGGVYSIYYMQSPDILEGPGYSNYVEYWMPFNGGIGLHDASWRGEFGGTIYQSNGSHGCINLPTDAAKLIYNTVEIGYPVVCYR